MTDSAAPTVGVVGTGRMGSAMAKALARAGRAAGRSTTASRDRAEALAAELGARVAATPAEVAAAADVTLTMLADDDAVAQVYGGRRRAPGRGASRARCSSTSAPSRPRRSGRSRAAARAAGRRPAGRAGERLDRDWPRPAS